MTDVLQWLKEFLYDRTIYAIASIEAVVILWLVGALLRNTNARLADQKAAAADRLLDQKAASTLLQSAHEAAASRERQLLEQSERDARENSESLRRLASSLQQLLQKTARRAKYSPSPSGLTSPPDEPKT